MAIDLPDPSVPLVREGGLVHERWYPILKLWAAQFNTLTGSSDSGIAALDTRLDALEVLTTQGDIIVRGASAPARLALGASGQFLKSNGTTLVYDTVSAVVSAGVSGSVSAAATLDISLGSADLYEIDLIAFNPVTDNVNLLMRVSQGAVFLTGASDYFYAFDSGASVPDEAADFIALTGTIGNAAAEFATVTVRVFRPSAASFRKSVTWVGGGRTGTPVSFGVNGIGALLLNTDAIDGVRFYPSSGNIASMYSAVRSYSFT